MQFTGQLTDISIDFKTKKPKVTFLVNERWTLEQLEILKQLEKLSIEAKKYRRKRSFDANAYARELIGKLALEMNLTDIEVYRQEIGKAGVYEVLPLKDEAVDRFIETWSRQGLGWICETFKSKFEGYTNVRAFYGSSVYDSKEMSRLIENIKIDCKLYGIETKSDAEIKRMLKEWEERKWK